MQTSSEIHNDAVPPPASPVEAADAVACEPTIVIPSAAADGAEAVAQAPASQTAAAVNPDAAAEAALGAVAELPCSHSSLPPPAVVSTDGTAARPGDVDSLPIASSPVDMSTDADPQPASPVEAKDAVACEPTNAIPSAAADGAEAVAQAPASQNAGELLG
jgi:hypothetical protein